ncbi:hypothetical protein, partial [Kitasatospora phosalacinea]|uniref:hypothetical protein n=1 Tax=Kitasatospora phosalacinea TaxID=2065 RepID=UPI0005260273
MRNTSRCFSFVAPAANGLTNASSSFAANAAVSPSVTFSHAPPPAADGPRTGTRCRAACNNPTPPATTPAT